MKNHKPYFRHMRLPLDPPNPFFTDPCVDLIRDQFEIIRRVREPSNTRDETEWRKKIANDALRVAQELEW